MAVEGQTTGTDEVSRSASELAGRAAQLSEALDHFETEVSADSGPEEVSADSGPEEVSADSGPEEVSVGDISASKPSAKDTEPQQD